MTMIEHEKPAVAVRQDRPLDPHGFKHVMARFPSGVTVATTRTRDGAPIGITASSFTSLSLEPPMVLVCVAESAMSFDVFVTSASFGISVLAHGQDEVALRYATAGAVKFGDADHFAGAASGVPLIRDAVAHVECHTHQVVHAGDHAIVIGRVVHTASDSSQRPLLTFDRSFGSFERNPR